MNALPCSLKSTIQVAFILFLFFTPSEAPAQPSSGTLNIFGDTYSYSGIDLTTTDFAGADPLYTGCGGGGLGFYQGASVVEDRLYICDETGSAGEDAAMLIGSSTGYEFTAASTLDYLAYTSGTDVDPMAIDWVSDAHPNPGNNNDINVWVLLPRGGASEAAIVVALDRDGYDGTGVHFSDWSISSATAGMTGFTWPTLAPDPEGRATAACTDVPTSPTKWYVGGVKIVDGTKHFAYQVLDLTTNSFINDNAVYLDQIGTPDESGEDWEENRDLRGLGSDGTHFYAAVKKPATEDELWLYRFDSLPDPSSGGDTARTGNPPDSASLTALVYPSGDRYDRTGFTCGRLVEFDGQLRPVFYVLCESYLYTLVPTDVVLPTPSPTPPTGIDEGWKRYR